MKKNKLKVLGIILLVVVIFIISTSRIGYYIACKHANHKIEALNLPDGYTVYGQTKAEASDIYWVHMRSEKVIICEDGIEYVQDYIKKNNSELALAHISVGEFAGMTDMCMYDFDALSDEEREEILADGSEKYVRIVYEHKYPWLPASWIFFNPVY